MTVIMRKNLREKCLLKVPASSEFGEGTLYVTSLAVAYEVSGMGIYLNFVPRHALTGFDVSRSGLFGARRCRIEWAEDGTRHHFDLRTRRYRDLESALNPSSPLPDELV